VDRPEEEAGRVDARRLGYNAPRMFVHIVFWKLHETTANGGTRTKNAQELKRRFEALRGVIPGLLRCDVGIDVIRGAESADIALYTEFDSKAAYEAYAAHPAHQAIVGFLKEARSERRACDYDA
jgi:hypothetical protein